MKELHKRLFCVATARQRRPTIGSWTDDSRLGRARASGTSGALDAASWRRGAGRTCGFAPLAGGRAMRGLHASPPTLRRRRPLEPQPESRRPLHRGPGRLGSQRPAARPMDVTYQYF